MTRKQIYNQIAAFTGDWKSARRKAEIFEHHCCVTLAQVAGICLSFGKFSDEHGNYYGENRDTLNFDYTEADGCRHHFAIID